MLILVGGIIAISLSGCGTSSSPVFKPFINTFIGIRGSSWKPGRTQTVHFVTDTVFPIQDNDDPKSQDIFRYVTARFAGVKASAVRTGTLLRKGQTYDHFLNAHDDTYDDPSSDLFVFWAAVLPHTGKLKNAQYRFIVTACTVAGHCENSMTIVCVKNGKITGKPRPYGSPPKNYFPATTCMNPLLDAPDDDYGITYGKAIGYDGATSRKPVPIPEGWARPISPFNEPARSYYR